MLFASGIHAQENALIVKTPKNLDDVLERKLSLDKKRLKNNQFSIQIFSGNYDMAQVFLDSFSKSFPEKNAKLTLFTMFLDLGVFSCFIDNLSRSYFFSRNSMVGGPQKHKFWTRLPPKGTKH